MSRACNPRTWELEAERSLVQGHPQLSSVFECLRPEWLLSTTRPFPKKQQKDDVMLYSPASKSESLEGRNWAVLHSVPQASCWMWPVTCLPGPDISRQGEPRG